MLRILLWSFVEENASVYSSLVFQIEQAEWERVNKELRSHGLPPVGIVHPTHATKYSGWYR